MVTETTAQIADKSSVVALRASKQKGLDKDLINSNIDLLYAHIEAGMEADDEARARRTINLLRLQLKNLKAA